MMQLADSHWTLTRHQGLCQALPFHKLVYEILGRGYHSYLHFANENLSGRAVSNLPGVTGPWHPLNTGKGLSHSRGVGCQPCANDPNALIVLLGSVISLTPFHCWKESLDSLGYPTKQNTAPELLPAFSVSMNSSSIDRSHCLSHKRKSQSSCLFSLPAHIQSVSNASALSLMCPLPSVPMTTPA